MIMCMEFSDFADVFWSAIYMVDLRNVKGFVFVLINMCGVEFVV